MVRPALVKRVVQLGIGSSKHRRSLSSQIPPNGQKAEDRSSVLQLIQKDFDLWKYDSTPKEEFIPPAIESERLVKALREATNAKIVKMHADLDKSREKLHQGAAEIKYEIDQTFKIFSRCFVGTTTFLGLAAAVAISKKREVNAQDMQ